MTGPYEGWTMQEKLRELQRLRAEHRAIAPGRESVAVLSGPLVSPAPLFNAITDGLLEAGRGNDARQIGLDGSRERVANRFLDAAETASERMRVADLYFASDRAAIAQAGRDRETDSSALTTVALVGGAVALAGLGYLIAKVLSSDEDPANIVSFSDPVQL
ncbi:hypothetical protein [Rhodanobacter aciditrophus]|uniref:hypothetical protein n=1 Tax=Rhodanobacter aciditrophus TaxID=1623218 RepID=UPI003CF48EA2